MGRRDVLGELEHHVLLAALRLGPEAYSARIVEELESQTGREVSAASVFITLQRLERKGMVRSSTRVAGEIDLRERRYFRVSAAGLSAVREARNRYLSLWRGLEDVLEVNR